MDHKQIQDAVGVLSKIVETSHYKDPAVLVDPDKKEDKSEEGN